LLEIVVHEIRGEYPVYKVGDKITIEDPQIVLEKTDALCIHALSTLLHYITILEHKWCPVELGLTTPDVLKVPIYNALTQVNPIQMDEQ